MSVYQERARLLKGAVAELVYYAVSFMKTIVEVNGMIATQPIAVESLHVFKVIICNARSRHRQVGYI